MSKGGKGADKRTQLFQAVEKEKLDQLRYLTLHSGLEFGRVRNDAGLTALHVAAADNKPKALLVLLDVLRQRREVTEALTTTQDDGLTPLMLACQAGALKCVEHLVYYGAKRDVKSPAGLTAKDYASRNRKKDVVAYLDEEEAAEKGLGDAGADSAAAEVDPDGMTSTQRNRLKKKQLREAEQKSFLAAVAAAAASMPPPEEEEEEGEGAETAAGAEGSSGSAAAAGGAGAPAAGGAGSASSSASSVASSASSVLPPLPAKTPVPAWPEVKAAIDDKRRELKVERGAAAAGAGAAGDAALPEGQLIDPALWHANLLNRLELRITGLTSLPPHIGHLTALQTLILRGNGLTELPETIGLLKELKFLDVSQNALTVLPASLSKLSKLEVLDLAGNALTTVEPLAGLTSLTFLMLDRNAITDVSPLNWSGLARLGTLSISNNKLTGLPDEIGALGNSLENLNIADNEVVELPSGLAELKEKKIKSLKLLPNPIADPKVRKVLNSDRPEKMVKELFKLLESSGGAGKKGGKGKK